MSSTFFNDYSMLHRVTPCYTVYYNTNTPEDNTMIDVPMEPTETYYLRLREARQAERDNTKDQPPNSNHSSSTGQLRRPDSV